MKKCLLALSLAVCMTEATTTLLGQSVSPRSNIILIFADDLRYNDISYNQLFHSSGCRWVTFTANLYHGFSKNCTIFAKIQVVSDTGLVVTLRQKIQNRGNW